MLQKEQRLTLAASDMAVEDALDQLAAYDLVDRNDESSYDSDDFPKVIFASDDDGLVCGGCNKYLTDL